MAKGLGVRREVEIRLARGRISEKERNKNILKCFKIFVNMNFLIYAECSKIEDEDSSCLSQNT